MDDEETLQRDALRRVMPLPEEDAADELADALARSRFRAEQLGCAEDVRLGPYILRRELGRGGMGVVFEAHDPVLMIPIALKLLQRGVGKDGSEADLRLQREAQALASVRGDHVVRVFSAGFYKNQAWIAMEFVAGPNLSEWLRYQREAGAVGWRTILAKYVDAARGLRSIHLAGLIHRDFKPHNAVVDPDGSVRVLDFGLATTDRRPVDPAQIPADHLRCPGLTNTGELVGTTRYASPEQFVGTDLDHRSDQFSFCVALFEALWGHPPIPDGSSTGKRLHDSDGAATIPRPTMGDVPGWLTAAVLRGLAYRPDDRFPDMAALLHELTRDRRRPFIVGALVFASVLIGGLAASVFARPPDELETCLAGQVEIDALAGPGARLGRHIAAWKAAHTIACRDTHRGSKPDTLLARRQLCLDHDRKTLGALLAQAPEADRERLVGELPPPANCLDEGLGRVAIPHDPITRDRVARVDDLLAEAEAGRMLGNYTAAAETARAAVTAAEAAHHLPAAARAQFALGHLERLRDRRDAAMAALLLATTAASRSEDLALAVDAWHELVALAVLGDHAADNADAYLQLAANLLPAVHQGADPETASAAVQELWAEHADIRGLVLYAKGQLADAIATHTDAIARWQRLTDLTDVRGELAASLLNRGRARSGTGDHAAAIADFTAALQIELARFGADHPSLAANHRALGQEHLEVPDYPAAEREAQRALAIDTAHAAATDVAHDLQLLAKISLDAGQPELAAQRAAAAQEAIARNPAASPALRADAAYFAATVATVRDDPAAETLWSRAAAAYAQVSNARAACQQANAHIQRGHLALFAGRLAETAEAADQADVVLRRAGDLGCQAGADALWLRGRILLVREDHAGALRYLEEAAARTPVSEAIRADILDDLAHTLHALGRDPQHLREIVLEAQRHYEGRNLHAEAESLARLLVSTPAHPR